MGAELVRGVARRQRAADLALTAARQVNTQSPRAGRMRLAKQRLNASRSLERPPRLDVNLERECEERPILAAAQLSLLILDESFSANANHVMPS
jgi:hypothetical protein